MPSTPMTRTQSHNGVAHQASAVAERSAETWKLGAKAITVPVDLVSKLPTVDLTQPVTQFFQYMQKAVDLNRDLTTAWVETVMSLSGVVREHAEKVSHIVKDEAESIADLAHEQAEQVEQAAREQAEKIEQAEKEEARQARQAEREHAEQVERAARKQAEKIEQAEREQAEKEEQAKKEEARQARQAEREQAKQARERYEGLTKAELSDELAERALPKTGNVDELIERLVSADSK